MPARGASGHWSRSGARASPPRRRRSHRYPGDSPPPRASAARSWGGSGMHSSSTGGRDSGWEKTALHSAGGSERSVFPSSGCRSGRSRPPTGLPGECMSRQDDPEETAHPARVARAKDDLDGSRIEHADLRTAVKWGSSSSAGMYLRIASWVKKKSRAVTGTPSFQRASRRMWYVSVNGGFVVNSTFETSFGRKTRSGRASNAPSRTSASYPRSCTSRGAD